MNNIALPALHGTNPLGFLAALGTFRSAALKWPDVRLSWDCDDVTPSPALSFQAEVTIDELVEELTIQRDEWLHSPLLNNSHSDIKEIDLATWATELSSDNSRLPLEELFLALAAEGAKDLKGNNKPSHLHFTAGQQQFLDIVREVGLAATPQRLLEALHGPWRFDSVAKTLRWDPRGERIYALRGFNPSKDPAQNVPGADWLAFIGLSFFPTTNRRGTLLTTACNRDWKVSAFRWPLWSDSLRFSEVKELMLSNFLDERERTKLVATQLGAVGVQTILEAPIRRSDQGGYGSFGAASVLATATRRNSRGS
jgi:hypothetical protein